MPLLEASHQVLAGVPPPRAGRTNHRDATHGTDRTTGLGRYERFLYARKVLATGISGTPN